VPLPPHKSHLRRRAICCNLLLPAHKPSSKRIFASIPHANKKIKFIIISNDKNNERNDRFESYPKPSETDQRLKNQPEYIDQQPGYFHNKSINDIPGTQYQRESDDPSKDTQESDES